MRIRLIPEPETQRVARLLVEALEVGTGKFEQDVTHELFAGFGLDIDAVLAEAEPGPGRKERLREHAAVSLASAALTVAALVDAIVRAGGRYVAMLEDIYSFLAEQTTTTFGSSEVVTVDPGALQEPLIVSPAFLEEVRTLHSRLVEVRATVVQGDLINRFLGKDGEEFFGRWPADRDNRGDETGSFFGASSLPDDRLELVEGVLALPHLLGAWSSRAENEPDWGAPLLLNAARDAQLAAERLVARAETLVSAHAGALERLASTSVEHAVASVYATAVDRESLQREVRAFREDRVLGDWIRQDGIDGLSADSVVGLRNGEPVVVDSEDRYRGPVGQLASWCAMSRRGMVSSNRLAYFRERLHNPEVAGEWCRRMARACSEAREWMGNTWLPGSGTLQQHEKVEQIEQLLRLPMWRQRSLIYEIWILFTTIRACLAGGWVVELAGVEQDGSGWRLSLAPSPDPVAVLRRAERDLTLQVWREPRRIAVDGGQLTPDVTISAPGTPPVDLVVVEAKDKYRLVTGVGPGVASDRSALAVAQKYRWRLRSRLTWLCNHASFANEIDPTRNHGDAWSAVHLAEEFRPGSVPDAFGSTVLAATEAVFDHG